MQTHKIVLAGLALLLGIIALTPTAEAAFGETCAETSTTLAASTRTFSLYLEGDPCNDPFVPIEAGASFGFICSVTTSGAVPPGAATSIEIRIYADDTSFPNGATFIRQQTFTEPTCIVDLVTFYCTSDGTATGSPRYGSLRFYIRAIKTTIPTYDVNSDAGTWGRVMCGSVLTSFSYSPDYTLYTGEDSVTHTATMFSSAFNTGRNVHLRIKCNELGAFSTITTGVAAPSQTVASIARSTGYPGFDAGCNMRSSLVLAGNSQISGATSTPYAVWFSASQGTISNGSRDVQLTTNRYVSYMWNLTGIVAAKTSGGANATNFIVGNDQEFVRAQGLKNPRGEFASGKAVSCQRTRPDNVNENALPMGNTDASGNTGNVEFAVVSPAGNWRITCSYTVANGNAASYQIVVGHLSPLTSDVNIAIAFNVTNESGVRYVNITALTRTVDVTCNCVISLFPDDAVRLTVAAYNVTSLTYTDFVLTRAPMTQITGADAMPKAAFYTKFVINESNLTHPVFAWVMGNLTSRPFLASSSYMMPGETTSGETVYNGNFSGNFTGNVTMLSALGQVIIETSIDDWIPFLIWGGILVFFLYYVAWAPAMGAAMGLGGAMLEEIGIPLYPRVAAIMVFIILFILHVMVTRSLIPAPWGRRGNEGSQNK